MDFAQRRSRSSMRIPEIRKCKVMMSLMTKTIYSIYTGGYNRLVQYIL